MKICSNALEPGKNNENHNLPSFQCGTKNTFQILKSDMGQENSHHLLETFKLVQPLWKTVTTNKEQHKSILSIPELGMETKN